MILVRTTMMVAVAALVLAVALPVPADDSESDLIKTEWLSYLGPNQVVPTILLGDVWVASAPCDEAGIGGVAFCETLQNETKPDRVAINVRDDLGPRVGFYYEFWNSTAGEVLWWGYACGHVNDLVPHTGQGGNTFDLDPDELVVIPDTLESLVLGQSMSIPSHRLPGEPVIDEANEALENLTGEENLIPYETPGIGGIPAPCGSPTLGTATVTVTWRYNATVFQD